MAKTITSVTEETEISNAATQLLGNRWTEIAMTKMITPRSGNYCHCGEDRVVLDLVQNAAQ